MAAENDRSQRWQKIAIDQLGYALNLVLAFTVAGLAYCFALLKDPGFIPGSSAKVWTKVSLLALTLAATFGLACVVNRLWDFRNTARRARKESEAPTVEEGRIRGKATWCLFYAELFVFAVGMFSLALALWLTYGSRLQ